MSMTEADSDVVITLPMDAVCGSTGFSIDIGGSVAKIVYRSKDDYTEGKPKDGIKGGSGEVHLATFSRDNIHDVVSYLQDRCDILHTQHPGTIYTCGLGSNEHRDLLEKEFSIRLQNSNEIDRFVDGLCYMLRAKGTANFKDTPQEGIRAAHPLIHMARNRYKYEGGRKEEYYMGDGTDLSLGVDSEKEVQFPFLMAMFGSGCPLFKVHDREGTWSHVDSTFMGGRFYLCLSRLLTNINDYSSIHQVVEESDGRTVDTTFGDLHTPNTPITMEDKPNVRYNVMDKLLQQDYDGVEVGDVVHSLLESVCEHLTQLSHYAARVSHTKTVYLVGNFTNSDIVRRWMTQYLCIKNSLLPQGEAISLEFIHHGGHVGALGAFLLPYLQAQKNSHNPPTRVSSISV